MSEEKFTRSQWKWRLECYGPELYKALSEAAEIFRSYEELHRAKQNHNKADQNAEFAAHYEKLLAKVRGEALERAKYKCQLCKSWDRLEVHHNTYRTIGRERPEDVIALCHTCHGKHHNMAGV